MKNKIKKICCSLFVTFALVIGSFFGLASGVVNTIATNLALAKYESSVQNTYEFKNTGEWTVLQNPTVADSVASEVNLSDKFKGSSNNLDITTLDEGSYTPAKRTEAKDNYALAIKATEAPTRVLSYKTDDDGKQVYKTDADGKYIYEKDTEDPTKDKIYTSNDGNTELYVKTADGYKKKIKETDTVNTYSYFRTNNTIKLTKNSHYVLSAYVWTKDTTASIVVEGTGFEAEYKNITTAGNWKYVELYLETSSDSDNDVYIYFYYGTQINDDDKLKGGIVENPTTNTLETGVVYLDEVKVTKINQTDFNNTTIEGEEKTTDKLSYSARYNVNDRLSESDFENFDISTDIYTTMYGQESYEQSLAEAKDFQNFVIKYREDSTTDKYEDYELENLYELYQNSNKFSVSVVEESNEEDLKITESVLDEDGKETFDDNGKKITEEVGYSTFNQNNHALKVVNNSRYTLGLLSAPIQIERFGYYRLSLYVRGIDEEDSATIKLLSYIKTGTNATEGELQLETKTVDAYTDSLDNSNNWVEVVFYIRASSLHDTQTFQLALLADKHSTVYFDNIRLENATSQAYSDGSNQLDLAPSSSLISKGVANGYFNYIKVDNEELFDANRKMTTTSPYYDADYTLAPYAPLNWSENTDNDDEVVAGIVSTNEAQYNNVKAELGNASNPIGLDKNGIALPKTNVLAIYAPRDLDNEETTRTFSYKSDNFSLSGNAAYKITFKVYASQSTEDSSFTGNITAKLISSSKTLAEFNTTISTGEWHTFTMLVRTDSNSKSSSLHLGIEEALGTVFFQEVGYEKLAEKTVTNDEGEDEKISVDTQYNELVKEYLALNASEQEKNPAVIADFAQNSSAVHSANKVEIVDDDDESNVTYKDYYQSFGYSLEEYAEDKNVVQGELGVLDTSKDVKLSDTYTLSANELNNPKANLNYALLIYNSTALQTKVNPNSSQTLSSSSYYELSFYVKTDLIKEGKGLTVTIDQLSVEFENINTETQNYGDLTETNGYKKFTVLVRTGDSSISGLNTVFTLGTEDDKFAGTALVSQISVVKLADKDAYDKLVEEVDANDNTTVVKNFFVEQVDEQDQPVDDLTLEIFFLIFSSLLLVVALVIAIVSVYIRRIPKVKTVVGTNNAEIKSNKTQETETEQKDGFV